MAARMPIAMQYRVSDAIKWEWSVDGAGPRICLGEESSSQLVAVWGRAVADDQVREAVLLTST